MRNSRYLFDTHADAKYVTRFLETLVFLDLADIESYCYIVPDHSIKMHPRGLETLVSGIEWCDHKLQLDRGPR